MNRIMALFAFVVLAGFVGILIWNVREPDLIAVAALTVVLIAIDFVTSSGKPKD